MIRKFDLKMPKPELPILNPAFPSNQYEIEISALLSTGAWRGISVMTFNPATYAAISTALDLCRQAQKEESWLREHFDLIPRYWIKRQLGKRRISFSQYFTIHPRNSYPITTIRLFLKRYAADFNNRLDAALEPVLEATQTTWYLILKELGFSRPIPRICCRIQTHNLPALLTALVNEQYVANDIAEAYRRWNECLQPAEAVYVSLDPIGGKLALDWEKLDNGGLPAGLEQVAVRIGGYEPRYLKCRINNINNEPEWIGYWPVIGLEASRVERSIRFILLQFDEQHT
jgi:hypothetical protein